MYGRFLWKKWEIFPEENRALFGARWYRPRVPPSPGEVTTELHTKVGAMLRKHVVVMVIE